MKQGILLLFLLWVSGCGYALTGTPPHGLKTVHVETFKNATYEPAVEIDLTNGIIERFLYDGTLRTTNRENADAVLKGTLTRYIREPLRYDSAEEISEYRLILMVDFSLWDSRSQKVIWEEKNFVGDTSFLISGPSAVSEGDARENAIQELARRIVDRAVEEWPE